MGVNAIHGSHLPPSWRTLYYITRLDDEVFKRAIGDGTIHPEVQRSKIRKLMEPDLSPPVLPPADSCKDAEALIADGQRFSCIYADPPWRYGNQGTRAATDNHYPTMTPADIGALSIADRPIANIAAENAHLHLWTTNAFLFDARAVMEAWGFEYKSCLVWVKPQMGIGNYWRVSHEFMLFGIRGRLPFENRGQMSWVKADRGGHSRKPGIVREMIEKVSPVPRIELFARERTPSWVVWGNQIEETLYAVDGPRETG